MLVILDRLAERGKDCLSFVSPIGSTPRTNFRIGERERDSTDELVDKLGKYPMNSE